MGCRVSVLVPFRLCDCGWLGRRNGVAKDRRPEKRTKCPHLTPTRLGIRGRRDTDYAPHQAQGPVWLKWSGESFYAILDSETLRTQAESSAERNRKYWDEQQKAAREGAKFDRLVGVQIDNGAGWRWTETVSHGKSEFTLPSIYSWDDTSRSRLLPPEFERPVKGPVFYPYAVYEGYTLNVRIPVQFGH